MEITSHLPRVDPTQMPVEKLAGSKAVSEQDKVAELSRQFEAVLVRQILTEAQKPTIKSKLHTEDTASSIHRDMMVNNMSDQISHAGGLGLAHQLEHDLARQTKVKPAASVASAKSATATTATATTATTATTASTAKTATATAASPVTHRAPALGHDHASGSILAHAPKQAYTLSRLPRWKH